MTLDLTDVEAELLHDACAFTLADLWNELADLRERRDEYEASGHAPIQVKKDIEHLTATIDGLQALQRRLEALIWPEQKEEDPDALRG